MVGDTVGFQIFSLLSSPSEYPNVKFSTCTWILGLPAHAWAVCGVCAMCRNRPEEGSMSKHEPAFLKRCEWLNKPACSWLPIWPSGAVQVPMEPMMAFRMTSNQPNVYLTFMAPQLRLHVLLSRQSTENAVHMDYREVLMWRHAAALPSAKG